MYSCRFSFDKKIDPTWWSSSNDSALPMQGWPGLFLGWETKTTPPTPHAMRPKYKEKLKEKIDPTLVVFGTSTCFVHFLLDGFLFPIWKHYHTLSCGHLTTSRDFMPLGQGGCIVSQVKKQKANCFYKKLPWFCFSLQTDLRDTPTEHMIQILMQEKFWLRGNKKPWGEYVCFCRSLLSLWLFKHRGWGRVNSLSKEAPRITEVSIWPQICGPEKPTYLDQKDGKGRSTWAGFQRCFLGFISVRTFLSGFIEV